MPRKTAHKLTPVLCLNRLKANTGIVKRNRNLHVSKIKHRTGLRGETASGQTPGCECLCEWQEQQLSTGECLQLTLWWSDASRNGPESAQDWSTDTRSVRLLSYSHTVRLLMLLNSFIVILLAAKCTDKVRRLKKRKHLTPKTDLRHYAWTQGSR